MSAFLIKAPKKHIQLQWLDFAIGFAAIIDVYDWRVIDNWLRELKRWSPAMKVIMYYGSQDERRDVRLALMDNTMEEYHVMVTT